jgi:hypothetical protein
MVKPKVKAKLRLPHPLWLYIVGFIFFVYLFTQILGFHADDAHNILLSGLYLVEFGVHEGSHIVTAWLPPIVTASAGSIGEVLFTVFVLIAAIKGRAYFAAVFAGLWVMFSMHNAGLYMADARAQLIPLIGPSENPIHDWHFVFGQLGWLGNDTLIGGTVVNVGVGIGVLSLVWGLFLIILKIMKKV